jgi:hypothetical protein
MTCHGSHRDHTQLNAVPTSVTFADTLISRAITPPVPDHTHFLAPR